VAAADDDNNQKGVVNLVDDAIIADTDAIGIFFAAHLLDAVRARIARERVNLGLQRRLNGARQLAKLASRGGGELDRVDYLFESEFRFQCLPRNRPFGCHLRTRTP
jgi:hypothetical protein